MTTLQFKCTLLSDVILNQKAASTGPNQTLDFIPGSCFLGIVADKLYKEKEYDNDLCWEIFHSGKVKFGDAHPTCFDNSGKLIPKRSVKIPICLWHPKDKEIDEEAFVSYYCREKNTQPSTRGFYVFEDNDAYKSRVSKNFAIKSAYDRNKRRSEDEKMFGYESLEKGSVFFFEIDIADDKYSKEIVESLRGTKRIGRSRTAQYGLVDIKHLKDNEKFEEEKSTANLNTITYFDGTKAINADCAIIYADSRLIFFDTNGLPTYNINAENLGLKGEIIWQLSQVRTFKYSPWNYKRQCFDADRCGFEKGSVFVVKTSETTFQSKHVGYYQNEGFGKVLYNPEFLQWYEKDGHFNCLFRNYKPKMNNVFEESEFLEQNIEVVNFVIAKKQQEISLQHIYADVHDWIWKKHNIDRFNGEKFKAQWGTIRSIAMRFKKIDDLKYHLFDTANSKAYLKHGVAKYLWAEKQRLENFQEFVNNLNDDNAQLSIINLASEMQKALK